MSKEDVQDFLWSDPIPQTKVPCFRTRACIRGCKLFFVDSITSNGDDRRRVALFVGEKRKSRTYERPWLPNNTSRTRSRSAYPRQLCLDSGEHSCNPKIGFRGEQSLSWFDSLIGDTSYVVDREDCSAVQRTHSSSHFYWLL